MCVTITPPQTVLFPTKTVFSLSSVTDLQCQVWKNTKYFILVEGEEIHKTAIIHTLMDSVDTDYVLYWSQPTLKLNSEHFYLQKREESCFET